MAEEQASLQPEALLVSLHQSLKKRYQSVSVELLPHSLFEELA